MIDFFNDVMTDLMVEYRELFESFPTWLYWVYFILMGIALIYSLSLSRVLPKIVWIILSLTVPFFAFPLQLIFHFSGAEFWKTYFDENSSGVRRKAYPIRIRFFVIPAVGACIFELFKQMIKNTRSIRLPWPDMNSTDAPWTFTGAALAFTIVTILTYFSDRRAAVYLLADKDGPHGDTVYYSELRGHKIYEMVDETIPEYHIEELAKRFSLSRPLPPGGSNVFVEDVGKSRYNVTLFSQNDYNTLTDIEAVGALKSTTTLNIDKITFVNWDLGTDKRLTDDTHGSRHILWRISKRMLPTVMEAVASYSLIWFILTPNALRIHVILLKWVLGWFT